MQAIVTKYHGPGNTRGARISAAAQAGRIYVGYDHALNLEENHLAAAKKFVAKMRWPENLWTGGQLPNGTFAHVHV